jgi:hypothetical protein
MWSSRARADVMRYMGDLPQGGIDKSTLLRECVPPTPAQ